MKLDNNIIDWLLESNNPAIEYRTKTELLMEKMENTKVIDWINKILPKDWKNTKGLWLTYYYNSIAECNINGKEVGINNNDIKNCFKNNNFKFGCADFMHIRALIKLGFENELKNIGIIDLLENRQLLDGGYLCLQKLDKYNNIPKSCVKCNNLALMFLSECKKRNINLSIEKKLIQYFWNHNLFYKSNDKSTLMINGREGWKTIDTFYPFEVMRVGIQNIIEAFCVLGYGKDKKLKKAWDIIENKKDKDGKYILEGTLSKSYLPKEKIGKPSKWVTFYTLLAKKYKEEK